MEIYLPEKLPVGCDENNMPGLIEWWAGRAIPDSRRGIQQASRKLNEKTGWNNFSEYKIKKVIVDGVEVPCSLNPLFTSTKLEFVSAYQLIKNVKTPNDSNIYEEMIRQAVNYGLKEGKVCEQLLKEYTDMPKERVNRIADTVKQKIEYLSLFREGKKIWKQEKYW